MYKNYSMDVDVEKSCHTKLAYSIRSQNDSSVQNQNGLSHTSPINLLRSSDGSVTQAAWP